MPVLEVRAGMFGPVSVIDTPRARQLVMCDTVQGASFHEPSAAAVEPTVPAGPGPIPEAAYQLMWLAAGTRQPRSRALMVGLGSGSGAVALLHQFPDLQLDVVEIDPTVVSMARAYFPLLPHLERRHRIRIVTADAREFVAAVRIPYAFAVIDVDCDRNRTHACLRSSSFLERAAAAANEIWLNAIGSLESARLHGLLHDLDRVGRPVTFLFSPVPLTDWLPVRRNWVLTTAMLAPADLLALTPFPDLHGPAVDFARTAYRDLVTNVLTRAEARLRAPG